MIITTIKIIIIRKIIKYIYKKIEREKREREKTIDIYLRHKGIQ